MLCTFHLHRCIIAEAAATYCAHCLQAGIQSSATALLSMTSLHYFTVWSLRRKQFCTPKGKFLQKLQFIRDLCCYVRQQECKEGAVKQSNTLICKTPCHESVRNIDTYDNGAYVECASNERSFHLAHPFFSLPRCEVTAINDVPTFAHTFQTLLCKA